MSSARPEDDDAVVAVVAVVAVITLMLQLLHDLSIILLWTLSPQPKRWTNCSSRRATGCGGKNKTEGRPGLLEVQLVVVGAGCAVGVVEEGTLTERVSREGERADAEALAVEDIVSAGFILAQNGALRSIQFKSNLGTRTFAFGFLD